MDIFCWQTLQTMWAVLYLHHSCSRNAFSKSDVCPKKYRAATGMIPVFRGAAGKDFGGFHPRQWRCLHCFCQMHAALQCRLGSGPEGQNIQRNTGGTDPISKHLTMGALKLCKNSLSEFQWWFWISQLPSRIIKNKRIKPSNFELHWRGKEGSELEIPIWNVQIGFSFQKKI